MTQQRSFPRKRINKLNKDKKWRKEIMRMRMKRMKKTKLLRKSLKIKNDCSLYPCNKYFYYIFFDPSLSLLKITCLASEKE